MNKGFIMIETLIVFVLMGILSSSLYSYMRFKAYSQKQFISEEYWIQLTKECDFSCVLQKDSP